MRGILACTPKKHSEEGAASAPAVFGQLPASKAQQRSVWGCRGVTMLGCMQWDSKPRPESVWECRAATLLASSQVCLPRAVPLPCCAAQSSGLQVTLHSWSYAACLEPLRVCPQPSRVQNSLCHAPDAAREGDNFKVTGHCCNPELSVPCMACESRHACGELFLACQVDAPLPAALPKAGANCLEALTRCVQVEGQRPMLGVYEVVCDMLLDMSEACRAAAAERPGGAEAGDFAEAVALEHWRKACPGLCIQAELFQGQGQGMHAQHLRRWACERVQLRQTLCLP